MLKRLKSVSTLLFLMGVSTGTAYAVAESGITDVKITQQNGSCTGIVKDTTGETVIGASVVVKGTTNGTITGIDGDFSLNNVKQGDIIQISFVGYKTVEVKWNGQPLNVTLKDDTEMLGEVVVTGYGGQQLRTKVTNSISKVKQESLNVGMHSNPAQALSGAVAGLKVIQSSGSPGATPTIILRGGTNLDGTGSPLVVVDGQLRDSMSDINPEDIESMDVLKDAGATALYGARASNGVILITTKRGKAGFREINFKAKLGLSYARTPYEFLEAGEYIKAMRKAHWDAGHLFQDKDGNTKTYWGNWESYLNGKQPFGTGNNHDKTDSRRDATFLGAYSRKDNSLAGTVYKKIMGHFDESINRYIWDADVIVYRLAGVYLMMAEIANMEGGDVASYINKIRERAYGKNWDATKYGYTNGNFTENELAILHEKDKEMLGEGQRWYDLKRMTLTKGGKHLVFCPEGSKDGQKAILTEAEAYKLYWPIETNMITKDPELTQTPGY